jgi:hypothetical protein
MGEVLGGNLSTAVGIAISPIPVIATVLMLLAPKARAASVGFAAGWLVGIAVAVGVLSVVATSLSGGPLLSDGARTTIYLLLGVLLLGLAVRQFRHRGQAGVPAWMSAVDSMSVGKAAGLGAALAALNPKNLGLAAAAGVDIGSADLTTGQTVVEVVVFTLVAGCSVLLPVLAYLIRPASMAGPLASLKDWLVENNATVMAVLLLVIGVVLVGKGIAVG